MFLRRGNNLWYFGAGLLGPLFAVFTENIGGDVLEISWLWAVFLVTSGFLMIVVGKLSDKYFSKESLLILGYLLNFVSTVCYLFVSKPIHLLFVQIGFGIATALATPTWDALYSKYQEDKNSGFDWGLSEGEAVIITGVAMVFGGLLVDSFSFRALFLAMAMVQLASLAYVVWTVRLSRRVFA